MSAVASTSNIWNRFTTKASEFAKSSDAQAISLVVAADSFMLGVVTGLRDAIGPNVHWAMFPNTPASSVDIVVGCAVAAVGVAACLGFELFASRETAS